MANNTLDERELEILRNADFIASRPDQANRRNGGCTLMILGGRDASHHHSTVKRLIKKGLMRSERHGYRSGRTYFITELGRAAVKERNEQQ